MQYIYCRSASGSTDIFLFHLGSVVRQIPKTTFNMQRKLVTLLAIAGSDCSGGAGIQADIRAAARRNVYALTALTAVTSQNSKGLSAFHPLPPECLKSQLDAISQEVVPDAVKIGMIGSSANARVIADYLKTLPQDVPVVTDPVLATSAGGDLTGEKKELAEILVSEICPLSDIITPNIPEAALFLNIDMSEILKRPTESTARELMGIMNCDALILKGGHLSDDFITDTLVLNEDVDGDMKHRHPRFECINLHGTGCIYSSLLAAELAKGNGIRESFRKAGSLISKIIADSREYALGTSGYGPLNIFDYTTTYI